MSLNDYMKNLNYQIKAKEIGEASWGTSRQKYKPMTLPNVDQLLTSGVQLNKQQNLRNEMVQKYIKDQDQPVQVSVDGEVRDFKFHQVEKPYITSPDEIDAQFGEYEQRKDLLEGRKEIYRDEYRDRIDDMADFIEMGRHRLVEIEQRKQEILAEMKTIQNSGDGSRFGEWVELRNLYVDYDQDETNHVKNRLIDAQSELSDLMDELEGHLRAVDGELDDNEEYKARIQNSIKLNKDKIKAYGEELQALNVGKLSSKQEPMESDDDYYQRLQRLADMPYADGNTEEKARIEQKQELRENLISITRDQEVINQVVNGIDFENFIKMYELNKIFPIFKERFLKIYGLNNNNVSAQDIINFAERVLEAPEASQKDSRDFEADFSVTENSLILYNGEGREYYFQYLEGTHKFKVNAKTITKTDLLFYSPTGEEGSYTNINIPSTLKNILGDIGRNSLGEVGLTMNSTKKQVIDRMKQLGIVSTDVRPRYLGLQPEGLKKIDHHIVGVGLHSDPKDIPTKVSFGDNVLDLKRLYLKNILSMTDQKGRKIHGIKNTPVSDNFVQVIFHIMNGKDVLSKDFSTLTNPEKLFLELILATSGLNKKHNTGGSSQSIEKVKHEYKIIIGEIESGNNGSEIRKKLYEILYSLAHLGAINKGQAQKQYKEIVKNFAF